MFLLTGFYLSNGRLVCHVTGLLLVLLLCVFFESYSDSMLSGYYTLRLPHKTDVIPWMYVQNHHWIIENFDLLVALHQNSKVLQFIL